MRKRVAPRVVLSEARPGWAHYERVALSELRLLGMCPALVGWCEETDVNHGWYTPQSERNRLPLAVAEVNHG